MQLLFSFSLQNILFLKGVASFSWNYSQNNFNYEAQIRFHVFFIYKFLINIIKSIRNGIRTHT